MQVSFGQNPMTTGAKIVGDSPYSAAIKTGISNAQKRLFGETAVKSRSKGNYALDISGTISQCRARNCSEYALSQCIEGLKAKYAANPKALEAIKMAVKSQHIKLYG